MRKPPQKHHNSFIFDNVIWSLQLKLCIASHNWISTRDVYIKYLQGWVRSLATQLSNDDVLMPNCVNLSQTKCSIVVIGVFLHGALILIAGQLPYCKRAHSLRFWNPTPFGNHVSATVTWSPTQSDYHDTEQNNIIMPSTCLECNQYQLLDHWFDCMRVQTDVFRSDDLPLREKGVKLSRPSSLVTSVRTMYMDWSRAPVESMLL